jgi:hypothetical protein
MGTILADTSIVKALSQHLAQPDLWRGKGGGRHLRLYMAMCRMAEGTDPSEFDPAKVPDEAHASITAWAEQHSGGVFQASLMALGEAANISSHAGLRDSLDHLSAHGLVDTVHAGQSDVHFQGGAFKGFATIWGVRNLGAPVRVSLREETRKEGSELSTNGVMEDVSKTRGDGYVCSIGDSVPDIDLSLDVWVEEPHLLRVVLSMKRKGITRLAVGVRALARELGLAVSSISEALQRWSSRYYVIDGEIDTEVLLNPDLNSRNRHEAMATANQRQRAARAAALEGQWRPVRLRIADQLRLIQRPGQWAFINWPAVHAIVSSQKVLRKVGRLPWLTPDEVRSIAARFEGDLTAMR